MQKSFRLYTVSIFPWFWVKLHSFKLYGISPEFKFMILVIHRPIACYIDLSTLMSIFKPSDLVFAFDRSLYLMVSLQILHSKTRYYSCVQSLRLRIVNKQPIPYAPLLFHCLLQKLLRNSYTLHIEMHHLLLTRNM